LVRVVVNPNANLGPVLSPSNQGYPTTAKWVKLLWEQNYAAFEGFQPQHYINVQDDAKLHIIALANPEVTGERIFGMTAPCTIREIVGILRELYPDRKWEEAPDIGEDKIVVVPKKRAEELLRQAYGSGFIGLKETVKANLVGLA
jgi:nucleoside-diphosphate-sugar epimerase